MNRGGNGKMGRVAVEVELINQDDIVRARDGMISADKVRRTRLSGIVDTGASYLVLPERVAKQLGVPTVGKAKVPYADKRRATRSVVEPVRVDLLGRHGIFNAIVEPKRDDALIGAIVLEALDLLVDCRTQTLQPRDPKQIIAEIE